MMIVELVRVVVGLVLILFVSGYALSWAFFPKNEDIAGDERIALSFVLSIAGVIFSVLFIDLMLGIDTTPSNIVVTIVALILLSLLVWKVHLYMINRRLKQTIVKRTLGYMDKIIRVIRLRWHA
ncbi:MAG: DUF1616 domain-containing protein [Candidatus Methanoperedens sp.]|nr:DUF1616 domain-containing protein [Candidatus Methanoperedens sp.]